MIKKIVQAIIISLIAKKVTDYLTRERYPRLALEYEPAVRKPGLLRQKPAVDSDASSDVVTEDTSLDAVPEFVGEASVIGKPAAEKAVQDKAVQDETVQDEGNGSEKTIGDAGLNEKALKAHTPVTVNADGSPIASGT